MDDLDAALDLARMISERVKDHPKWVGRRRHPCVGGEQRLPIGPTLDRLVSRPSWWRAPVSTAKP
jgi:hypothetical protein